MRYVTPGEQQLFDLLDKSRGPRGTGIPWIDAMTGVVKQRKPTPPPGQNRLVDLALGRVKGTKTKDVK